MKVKKIIGLIFLGFFLLLIAAILILSNVTFSSPRLNALVEEALEKSLGREVEIETLKIKLLQGVRIKEFVIGGSPDFKEDFFKVKELSISYKWLPLLFNRKIIIDEIILISPRMFIERSRRGRWNFEDLLALGSPGALHSSLGNVQSAPLDVTSFLISHIIIEDGIVSLRDAHISSSAPLTVLEDLELEVDGFSLTSSCRVEAEGTLRRGESFTPFSLIGDIDLPSRKIEAALMVKNLNFTPYEPYFREFTPLERCRGELNVDLSLDIDREGHLRIAGSMMGKGLGVKFASSGEDKFLFEEIEGADFSLDDFEFIGKVGDGLEVDQLRGDLKLDAGRLKLSALKSPLKNLKVALAMEEGVIDLEGLKFYLGEAGLFEMAGEIKSAGESFADIFKLTYQLKTDFRDLSLADFPLPDEFQKIVSGKLGGKFSLQGSDLTLANLSGTGELSLSEGKLANIPFLNLLGAILKTPSLKEINFEDISTDFVISDKFVKTDNLRLLSRDVLIQAEGGFDFATNLDYQIAIKLSPELSSQSPLLRQLYPVDETGAMLIEAPLTGTFKDPKLNLLQKPVERILEGTGLEHLKDILEIFRK